MKFPHRNLSIHDAHLGADRTPTQHITKNLYRVITVDRLQDIDILYLPGDWLDQTLLYEHDDIKDITLMELHLLETCAKTGTAIRLLKGTPSHDGNQLVRFEERAKKLFPHVDFKYIDDMLIEYIERFDIHVMYVPDEWASREAIYLEARRLLDTHQLTQVDFIVGHNQFQYQFPEHLRARVSALHEEDWNDMVRYTAYFGHVHTRSTYKKIEVAGSFDRLNHGEEKPKGYLVGEYLNEEEWTVTFYPNENAAIYHTLEIKEGEIDTQSLYTTLGQQIDQLNNEIINVRLAYYQEDFPIGVFVKQMQVAYPHVRFTTPIYRGQNATPTRLVLPDEETYSVIELNRDNLLRHAQSYMEECYVQDDRLLPLLSRYLTKLD